MMVWMPFTENLRTDIICLRIIIQIRLTNNIKCGMIVYHNEQGITMSNCENCVNYVYDEDAECYECMASLDEDEMYRFVSGRYSECPYYDPDDEYAVVRHQM